MRVINYILTTCVFYVHHVQERMTQNLSNDPTTTQSVSEDTVCWGALSMRGGFGRLARTLLPYMGHVSHTGLSHKEDHPSGHLGAAPYMRAGWRQWRHCYSSDPEE
jgi:hypothetical protein